MTADTMAADPEWMSLLQPRVEDDDDWDASNVDTTALLACVKRRLRGQASYREFLTAVSGASIDRKAALAALAGHKDLVATFLLCYPEEATPSGQVQLSAPDAQELVQPARQQPAAVPESRAERLAQKMSAGQDKAAEPVNPLRAMALEAKRRAAGAIAAPVPEKAKHTGNYAEMDRNHDGVVTRAEFERNPQNVPTQEEEDSAATFLAAVKTRLLEWGKEESYHDFVVAVSGSVDARAVCRILRGHDDLLRVFQNKFVSKAALRFIKQEMDDETPHAPSTAPPSHGRVKRELGSNIVKREMIKREAGSDTPHPPAYAPGTSRPAVTIDDDEDDDIEEEFKGGGKASILTGVKKGRDECVAQLAKLIFHRGGATKAHEGARQNIAFVNYAKRRAACPRFPRELFILRGAPGTGKTNYAMSRLSESVAFDPAERSAARLSHVAAADDFFVQYGEDGEAIHKYEARCLEAAHARNETRIGLAMEAGLHPLFVDCANLRLWEMRPYVELADAMGYVITVVEPWEACDRWDDVSFLELCGASSEGRLSGKAGAPQSTLTTMLDVFEPMPEDESSGDPLDAVRNAKRPAGSARVVVPGETTGGRGARNKNKGAKRPRRH